ncbi:hydrophobin 2 [Mycena floridula]|nr:hydrophobin 2 [Mycena floridula]
MQFKLSAITLALATLAVATPTSRTTAPSGTECCSSVQDASSPGVVTILKGLGIDASSITAQVGLDCSPITVIGAGGACSGTTVTCQDNSHSPLISLGCVPVTL